MLGGFMEEHEYGPSKKSDSKLIKIEECLRTTYEYSFRGKVLNITVASKDDNAVLEEVLVDGVVAELDSPHRVAAEVILDAEGIV